jgi:hypothetical protein
MLFFYFDINNFLNYFFKTQKQVAGEASTNGSGLLPAPPGKPNAQRERLLVRLTSSFVKIS